MWSTHLSWLEKSTSTIINSWGETIFQSENGGKFTGGYAKADPNWCLRNVNCILKPANLKHIIGLAWEKYKFLVKVSGRNNNFIKAPWLFQKLLLDTTMCDIIIIITAIIIMLGEPELQYIGSSKKVYPP